MADRNSGAGEDKSKLLEYLKIYIAGNDEKMESLRRFTERNPIPTIYRVPDVLHKMNERAYTPSMVSIGPLHRGKKHLQAMEGVKLSYMHLLFDRTGNFEETQNDCVDAMLKMEYNARRCYAEDVEHGEDDKLVKLEYYSKIRDVNGCADQNVGLANQKVRFAEMMLIDGCFMIELFYRRHRKQVDPILGNTFKYPDVMQDLLLLENQLPFEVLDKLFQLTVARITDSPTLTDCVLSFFWDVISVEEHTLKKKDNKPIFHVLHLVHSCYLPREEAEKPESNKERSNKERVHVLKNFKYSATELDLGGIKFVPGNKKKLFDFEFIPYSFFRFWKTSELKIPPFDVNDYTELFLRNFIALEQSCDVRNFIAPEQSCDALEQSCDMIVKSYFTSHALLMDRLINTTEDVQLLEKKEIIVNNMGSGEEVAHLFNHLCNNIDINRLYSTKACLEVIQYQKHRWPKFKVKLKRDYFSNPWTFISLMAAVALFVLTLLQTIYTMRS